MARQIENGLRYYGLDCDIFSARSKLHPLITRYHSDGLALFVHILCDVYDSGYYFKPDNYEDYLYALAYDLGMTVDKVKLVLAFMADRSLLDAYCLNKNTVFTSHGIQMRYAQAMKGRKRSVAEIKGEYWLLSEQDEQNLNAFYKREIKADKSGKNADKSGKNADKSGKNATNKIKENNIKDSKESKAPTLEEVTAYCKEIKSEINPKSFHSYYEARGWRINGEPIVSWKALIARWETTEKAPNDRTCGIVHDTYSAEELNSMFSHVITEDE